MRVVATTFAALFGAANFDELVEEYTAEGRIEGLPDGLVTLEKYQALEKAGVIHPFGAWDDDPGGADCPRLIGMLCVLEAVVPHHAEPLVCTESFFVSRAARASGAGLALLRMAETKARELGAPGLLVSAPVGGSLAVILPRRGYRATSQTFFKRFLDA